jgi:hypothetical protein
VLEGLEVVFVLFSFLFLFGFGGIVKGGLPSLFVGFGGGDGFLEFAEFLPVPLFGGRLSLYW